METKSQIRQDIYHEQNLFVPSDVQTQVRMNFFEEPAISVTNVVCDEQTVKNSLNTKKIEYFKLSFKSSKKNDFAIEIPNGEKIFCSRLLLETNEYFLTYFNSDVGGEKKNMKFTFGDSTDEFVQSKHIEEVILGIYTEYFGQSEFTIKDFYVIIKIKHMWLVSPYNILQYMIRCSKTLIKEIMLENMDKELLFEIIVLGNNLLHNEKNMKDEHKKKFTDALKIFSSSISTDINYILDKIDYIINNNMHELFDGRILVHHFIKNYSSLPVNYKIPSFDYIEYAIRLYKLHNLNKLTQIYDKIIDCYRNQYYIHFSFQSFSPITYYVIKYCAKLDDSLNNKNITKFISSLDVYRDKQTHSGQKFVLCFFPVCNVTVGDEIFMFFYTGRYMMKYLSMKIISIKKEENVLTTAKKNIITCDVEIDECCEKYTDAIVGKYHIQNLKKIKTDVIYIKKNKVKN